MPCKTYYNFIVLVSCHFSRHHKEIIPCYLTQSNLTWTVAHYWDLIPALPKWGLCPPEPPFPFYSR